ncbi:1675_t:CDS:10, partial [Scutellospora calospora]
MQIRPQESLEQDYQEVSDEIESTQNSDGYSIISSADHSTFTSRSNSPAIHLNNSQSTNHLLEQELSTINNQRTESDINLFQHNNDQAAVFSQDQNKHDQGQAASHPEDQSLNATYSSSTLKDTKEKFVPNNDQLTNSNNFTTEEIGSSSHANSTSTSAQTGSNDDMVSNNFDQMMNILSEFGETQNETSTTDLTDQTDQIDDPSKTADNICAHGSVDADYKKHIRAAIETYKYFNKDPSINITYKKDLAEYIPGLYRLLDLCKDDGSNGLVDKIIISKDSLKKLCNDMVPHSFISISEIEYNRLNNLSIRLIGCYGNHILIAKLLLNRNIINQKLFELLTMTRSSEYKENQPTLRSGIYLLIVNPDVGLVIHWPEAGCYEENASSHKKKNMTNLHSTLKDSFKKELQSRMQDCALEINRKMSMKALEFLVINGLGQENELLGPFRDAITLAKKENDLKKESEKNSIKTDAEYVTAMSREKLKELYSQFELKYSKTSLETLNVQLNDSVIKHIITKYPEMQQKIANVAKIDSVTWKKLKHRYFFARLITATACKEYTKTDSSNDDKAEITLSALKTFYSIFMDSEIDLHKVVKKHFETQQGIWKMVTSFFSYTNSNSTSTSKLDYSRINEISIRASTNNKDDSNFIKSLYSESWFSQNEEIKQGVIDAFFREYLKWRNDTFIPNVKGILPKSSGPLGKEIDRKFDEDFTLMKRELEKLEFEKICKKIEEQYQTGRKFKILEISDSHYGPTMLITYEVETTQPDQLQFTIYETSLEQSDSFELQENELHVPRPRLLTNAHGYTGISFQINPDVYELRKIAQFENKKYFIIFWNKKQPRYEIFFDNASRLKTIFQSSSPKPSRILNTEENCLFAINEPRGLVGIYHTQSGV